MLLGVASLPPSLIPTLRKIGILHHKKAKLRKHMRQSVYHSKKRARIDATRDWKWKLDLLKIEGLRKILSKMKLSWKSFQPLCERILPQEAKRNDKTV